MGIKKKKPGPSPIAHQERWQTLAMTPERHTEAAREYMDKHPQAKLVEAYRAVKRFYNDRK